MLFEVFKNLSFKITFEINIKKVKFLGGELNLDVGTVLPYLKPNTNIIYVNTNQIKHLANVIKQIPKGIESRISHNSITEDIFNLKKKKRCMTKH